MTPKISLFDLRADTSLDEELAAAFRRVLRSGRYILGPEVGAFEDECARFLGVKHAIGVSSGTDALIVSLMALGIAAGDEVVCPAFTFFAAAEAIMRVGATPVFADCGEDDFHVTRATIEAAMSPRTKAIIVAHLFGDRVDEMDAIVKLGMPVIEDAAQAFGVERAGTWGIAGCFSFYPTKTLGALGDGGMVVTGDDAFADRVRLLRVHGARQKYEHEAIGGNFRLDEVQAALLRVKLPHVRQWIGERREVARRYRELLGELPIVLPRDVEWHAYLPYVVETSRRDEIRARLANDGIETDICYPTPIDRSAPFASMRPTLRSVARARTALALPTQMAAVPVVRAAVRGVSDGSRDAEIALSKARSLESEGGRSRA